MHPLTSIGFISNHYYGNLEENDLSGLPDCLPAVDLFRQINTTIWGPARTNCCFYCSSAPDFELVILPLIPISVKPHRIKKASSPYKFITMKKLSFLIAYLFTLFVSQAQSDTISVKKPKTYNVSIKTVNNKMIRGKFYAVNDSQLVLVKSNNNHQYIPAENIRSFSAQRKNSALRGALIGFGIGAVTGIITGLASGDDPVYNEPVYDPFSAIVVGLNNAFAMTAQEKAVMGGLGLGISGAVIGAVVGAVAKKTFIIGGKKEKFRDLQSEIMMKLVRK